ncbi:TonB-dependent receptor [Flavobacteriaceae bacterium]|nr:TonB-dependent receptor [Flavobacteriaceae bacterium]MDA7724766.1 TonB-dependent receptor [Flavobacteriaceae bacterium]MDA7727832.1 TonB-dependent receptor [Flavobacteriaceae bacterium]MDA7848892.1 TonB-dependent receptor [Flavobacteriaceae bacterium]
MAQTINGVVKDQDHNLLFGATVYNSLNGKSTLTNEEGVFSIASIKGENKLVISYVGYTPKVLNVDGNTTNIGTIALENDSLEEVVISGTLRQVSKLKSAVQIELYSADFFRATPKASFFEAIEGINGVRPQLNCNICNTGDIHINGQEGANTMVLIDGLPLVSGLSTVYGLSGIPQSLIKQVEVIKGPASTLYGSEAIGGVINLITKLPENVHRFNIDAYTTSWGELNVDLGAKYRLKSVQGLIGVNYFNYSNPIDNNEDGFTDLTLQHRISIFNKIKMKRNSIAFRYFYEDRWGGEMNWNSDYRGGTQVYGESIYTSRIEVFGKYDVSENLFLQYSLNNHDQNSVYGSTSYNALQTIGFLQGIYSKALKNHNLLVGATYRYTSYDDNTPATQTKEVTTLPGLFIQDEWKLGNSQTLLSGIRYDRNSIYGDIWTPRLNYKWASNDESSIVRLGFGTGYRVVNVFTEDHAALTGARDVVFTEDILPEKSWNVNVNWNQKLYSKFGTIFDLDLSVFKTEFSNRILPDYETNPNQIIYSNLDGKSVTQGITLNINSLSANGLKVNLGATFIDSKIIQNNETEYPFLTENFSGNYRVSYTLFNPKITFDLSGTVIGPMKLPLLGPLDTRDPKSPVINIMNLQSNYSFKEFELYAGIKNIFNFKPASNSIARAFDPFDTGVEFASNGHVIATPNNPNALSFDPSYVYYSNQGTNGFLGLRYHIK